MGWPRSFGLLKVNSVKLIGASHQQGSVQFPVSKLNFKWSAVCRSKISLETEKSVLNGTKKKKKKKVEPVTSSESVSFLEKKDATDNMKKNNLREFEETEHLVTIWVLQVVHQTHGRDGWCWVHSNTRTNNYRDSKMESHFPLTVLCDPFMYSNKFIGIILTPRILLLVLLHSLSSWRIHLFYQIQHKILWGRTNGVSFIWIILHWSSGITLLHGSVTWPINQ